MILLYFSAREMLANKDVETGSMGGKYNDSFLLMFKLKVCVTMMRTAAFVSVHSHVVEPSPD